MWINLSVNSNLIASLVIVVLLGIWGKFWYDFYNKTRPDFKNISYSSVSESNSLDIYIPWTGAVAPFPVVIWIHGGGFSSWDKSSPHSLDRLLKEWFAVVSVNYRLSSEAKWPAQLTDMENIVKFIKQNAQTYKFNKDKIAAWGESAGGYLASMMDIALAQNPDTRIQAWVDWYGPVDFWTMDQDMEKTKIPREGWRNDEANSSESQLLGVTVKDNKEASTKASLLTYVQQLTSAPPLLLIMHGKEDTLVGYPQSERLRNAIQNKYWPTSLEYILLPHGTHGWGDFEDISAEDTVVKFLKKNLK